MRVAHVITRMIVGGAQENTLYSVDGLARLGYDVCLITGPETGTEGNLLTKGDYDFPVLYVPSLVRAVNPWADSRAAGELYRLFRRLRPDVVHTHSSKAGVLGRVAGRAARVPLLVHTLHSLVFHDYQPKSLNFAYRSTKRLLSPITDHYISVSDNIRVRAIAAGIGSPGRHSTIRSGFATREFVAQLLPPAEARQRLGLPVTGRVIVGVVSRLFPMKGHLDIIEAATRLVRRRPEVLFAFVGSGPMLEELRVLVERRGLTDHVRFLGRIDPSEIPVAFSAFDILAHASLREGLARVLPQAAIAGLPIVCYDLDGSAEVVTDGLNGFLVRARDHDMFAERLEQLVVDEELRHRFGAAAPGDIATEFSIDKMVSDLDALYQRLAAVRPVASAHAGLAPAAGAGPATS